MNKMDQQILAVKADDIQKILDATLKNGGFTPFTSNDQYLELLEKSLISRRGDLEEDPTFKQIIPYMVLKSGNQILYYLRASGTGETRLHNRMSVGFGGHIEAVDVDAASETIRTALLREINEELGKEVADANLKQLGYIYLDESAVDQVHIGILFAGTLDDKNISLQPDEIAKAEFVSADRLTEIINNAEYTPENWTRISWQYAKDLIQKA